MYINIHTHINILHLFSLFSSPMVSACEMCWFGQPQDPSYLRGRIWVEIMQHFSTWSRGSISQLRKRITYRAWITYRALPVLGLISEELEAMPTPLLLLLAPQHPSIPPRPLPRTRDGSFQPAARRRLPAPVTDYWALFTRGLSSKIILLLKSDDQLNYLFCARLLFSLEKFRISMKKISDRKMNSFGF